MNFWVMWITSFLFSFLAMEFVAWWLHKYVMHGFLWVLHEDHHIIRKDRKWQKNDFFALMFAIPSFFAILFGGMYNWPIIEGAGFGVTAYGLAYFLVHEIIIHRRWKWFNVNNKYVYAIRLAHAHHHQVKTKEGAKNFGMLVPPPNYLKTIN